MSFQKTVEDFVCEFCGNPVKGTGFTNHCPKCLWSKHVDVSPGDRMALCRGLMRPIRIDGSSPDYTIIHQCVKCDHRSKIKALPEDMPAVVMFVEHVGKS